MKVLDESDRRHVEAAEGWLDLGVWEEGRNEIIAVTPEARTHPEVMRVFFELLTARGQWQAIADGALALCLAEPECVHGWFYRAMALNRMDRTTEARETLLGVVEKFPGAFPIYYCLAACCCRLGDLKEARRWWRNAVAFSWNKDLEKIALEDPDLQKLWKGGARQR